MKILGAKQALIGDALCRYLSVEELRRALRYHLDIDLDEVALANNKRDLVFRVVDHADRHGLLVRLAEAACLVSAWQRTRIMALIPVENRFSALLSVMKICSIYLLECAKQAQNGQY